ncbi:protein XRI1 [Senna tora]|uniref:Protein XRI1 n=1 Tax=Senna tora TaxID=362788 RepID=A0A834W8Z5_9FABA|nr:protein XRI1 [Senna tora]
MGELHSLAYASILHGCSLGWDFHNLGVHNTEMPLVMGGNENDIAPCFSPIHSDFSSGYLEDAVVEFTSKRRHEPISTISREEANYLAKTKRQEKETIISASESPDSSTSSYKNPLTSTAISAGSISISEKMTRRRKRVITRVVYPFAMVKPGGILREGEVTLNEINERILMPPTRPVRHPVGDFASRPCVYAANGHGLSGKAVVALTRIHTQGRRGTITIIRTKG